MRVEAAGGRREEVEQRGVKGPEGGMNREMKRENETEKRRRDDGKRWRDEIKKRWKKDMR